MTSSLSPNSNVRVQTILLASALSLWCMPALAQPRPERLPDKDVKALIDQVDEGRDKFEGNLDGKFKGSTLRGPNGEVKVAGALQDYQDNTQKTPGSIYVERIPPAPRSRRSSNNPPPSTPSCKARRAR